MEVARRARPECQQSRKSGAGAAELADGWRAGDPTGSKIIPHTSAGEPRSVAVQTPAAESRQQVMGRWPSAFEMIPGKWPSGWRRTALERSPARHASATRGVNRRKRDFDSGDPCGSAPLSRPQRRLLPDLVITFFRDYSRNPPKPARHHPRHPRTPPNTPDTGADEQQTGTRFTTHRRRYLDPGRPVYDTPETFPGIRPPFPPVSPGSPRVPTNRPRFNSPDMRAFPPDIK